MVYTSAKPPLPETSDQLRARIPGWGVDLDPADRPSVPKERFDPTATGAHWEFPEQQPERQPRERSIEHAMLTPVFGTSCPPKALSGVMRRLAYRKYSEGRAAHWLLLLAADRVDAAESAATALARLRPDNPIAESGVMSEFTHGGRSSRLGRHRADVIHHPLDAVIVAGPWLLSGGIAVAGIRRLLRNRRSA
jgi:hypothetical protein